MSSKTEERANLYTDVVKHFATHGVLPAIEPQFLQELFDAAPPGSELEDALDAAMDQARSTE